MLVLRSQSIAGRGASKLGAAWTRATGWDGASIIPIGSSRMVDWCCHKTGVFLDGKCDTMIMAYTYGSVMGLVLHGFTGLNKIFMIYCLSSRLLITDHIVLPDLLDWHYDYIISAWSCFSRSDMTWWIIPSPVKLWYDEVVSDLMLMLHTWYKNHHQPHLS